MADRGDAGWLEGLLEDLRATWPGEAEARHAFNAMLEAGRPAYDSPRGKAIFSRKMDLEGIRNRALGRLSDAVLEIAGTRKPTEDEWERFGLPLAIVATDRHLFVVSASDQAEYHEDPEDMGMTDLVILDL